MTDKNPNHELSAQDHHLLIEEFNNTTNAATIGHCLPQLLENAADKHRDHVALICGADQVTYHELGVLVHRISQGLSDQGVQHGDLVSVVLDRSVYLVATLIAVLRLGDAYVPIDPMLPTLRIDQMLSDSTPRLIVVETSTSGAVPLNHQKVSVRIDEIVPDSRPGRIRETVHLQTRSSECEVWTKVDSEDIAYVMYTSGSTGKPKGVEMSHGALSNLLLSLQHEPGCDSADRMLAVTTISFDMAFLELFLPLISGATVVIAQTSDVRDPQALIDLMERHSINMMQGTPMLWQMLLEGGWQGQPRLAKMLSAGEALRHKLAADLLERGDVLWNLYGPTETSYLSCWRVSLHDGNIVIGQPIANSRLYVLSADGDPTPAPLGSFGELYIGGACVAKGYRGRADLTQQRFVDNPFHGGRMYRSGDLARFLAPGKLSIRGRIDTQIKLHGYRIEPGDIETAVAEHASIFSAVAELRHEMLVAYYIRRKEHGLSIAGKTSDELETELRLFVGSRLPAYMVPTFFVEVTAFPVTSNGKIDRAALPDPRPSLPHTGSSSNLEEDILAIWKEVLGHNRITLDDNFFQIGGDSLRVVQVRRKLEQILSRSLSSAHLFQYYTVRSLATFLTKPRQLAPENSTELESSIRSSSSSDIAIISSACRLPGGVETPEALWRLLETGHDAITKVPLDRWDADAVYSEGPAAPGKSYWRNGGFLASKPDSFDASFFGISPKEASRMDPSQHVMLETCWEALERARYTRESLLGSSTGVYCGVSNVAGHKNLDHASTMSLDDLIGYVATGSSGGTLSGRVSYTFGLEGPAMTIDSACSSSLVTTHLASNALRQGECDLAISAGVSLLENPGLHIEFSQVGGISADGRCRAFAADSQGTGWSERAAVVVLKRLSDARRDGDDVKGIIRATVVNHSGRSSASLTTPSASPQQRLIRTALASARLAPSEIDYVEAHGTGTKLGDPIEAAALADVFGGYDDCVKQVMCNGNGKPSSNGVPNERRTEPLWIGSIKSNLGHTQAAAGLVGLLKVILAMEHSVLPATLHASEPSREIDWERSGMALVHRDRAWIRAQSRPRRAGISAFGIGGTNAHVIVEEAKDPAIDRRGRMEEPMPPVTSRLPILLSGQSRQALIAQADKLRQYLSSSEYPSADLRDLAYSLATTRTHFRRRLVLHVDHNEDLVSKLEVLVSQPPVKPSKVSVNTGFAMLFTGQGGIPSKELMSAGERLSALFPVFRAALQEITTEFRALGLDQPLQEAQPALFTMQIALWRLWKSFGLTPTHVLGHSSGELAAAHVAGVMNLADACVLVAARHRLMEQLSSYQGAMAVLQADAEEVARVISLLELEGVEIAAYNAPTQIVVSGDRGPVEAVTAYLTKDGRRCKLLETPSAYHSHHMDNMLAAFEAVAKTVTFQPPSRAVVVSSVTGEVAQVRDLEYPNRSNRDVESVVTAMTATSL